MTPDTIENSASHNGSFDTAAYATAQAILAEDQKSAEAKIKNEMARRGRIIGLVVLIWTAVTIAAFAVAPGAVLAVELAWAVVVAAGVFWIWPTVVGKMNLKDIYAQYSAQLDVLEQAHIPFPNTASIEDVIAAIDAASDILSARDAKE